MQLSANLNSGKKLICIILAGIFTSCYFGEQNLDSMESMELTFDELPKEVQTVYQESTLKKKDSFFYEVKSLDLENNISHYWTGMNKGLFTKGHNHHFIINGQEFKLRANKGDPFVLRNNKLYYTKELNLSAKNFEKTTYMEINLGEHLKKTNQ